MFGPMGKAKLRQALYFPDLDLTPLVRGIFIHFTGKGWFETMSVLSYELYSQVKAQLYFFLNAKTKKKLEKMGLNLK